MNARTYVDCERFAEDIFTLVWFQFKVHPENIPCTMLPPNKYKSNLILNLTVKALNFYQILIRHRLYSVFEIVFSHDEDIDMQGELPAFIYKIFHFVYDYAACVEKMDVFSKCVYAFAVAVELALYLLSKGKKINLRGFPRLWNEYFTNELSDEFLAEGEFEGLLKLCEKRVPSETLDSFIANYCIPYNREDLYRKFCSLYSNFEGESSLMLQLSNVAEEQMNGAFDLRPHPRLGFAPHESRYPKDLFESPSKSEPESYPGKSPKKSTPEERKEQRHVKLNKLRLMYREKSIALAKENRKRSNSLPNIGLNSLVTHEGKEEQIHEKRNNLWLMDREKSLALSEKNHKRIHSLPNKSSNLYSSAEQSVYDVIFQRFQKLGFSSPKKVSKLPDDYTSPESSSCSYNISSKESTPDRRKTTEIVRREFDYSALGARPKEKNPLCYGMPDARDLEAERHFRKNRVISRKNKPVSDEVSSVSRKVKFATEEDNSLSSSEKSAAEKDSTVSRKGKCLTKEDNKQSKNSVSDEDNPALEKWKSPIKESGSYLWKAKSISALAETTHFWEGWKKSNLTSTEDKSSHEVESENTVVSKLKISTNNPEKNENASTEDDSLNKTEEKATKEDTFISKKGQLSPAQISTINKKGKTFAADTSPISKVKPTYEEVIFLSKKEKSSARASFFSMGKYPIEETSPVSMKSSIAEDSPLSDKSSTAKASPLFKKSFEKDSSSSMEKYSIEETSPVSKKLSTAEGRSLSKKTPTAKVSPLTLEKYPIEETSAVSKKSPIAEASPLSDKSSTAKASPLSKKFSTAKASPLFKKSSEKDSSSSMEKYSIEETSPVSKKLSSAESRSLSKKSPTAKVSPLTLEKYPIEETSAISKKSPIAKASPLSGKSSTVRASPLSKKFSTEKASPLSKKFTEKPSPLSMEKYSIEETSPVSKKLSTAEGRSSFKKYPIAKASPLSKKTSTAKASPISEKSATEEASHLSKKSPTAKASPVSEKSSTAIASSLPKKSSTEKASPISEKSSTAKASTLSKKLTAKASPLSMKSSTLEANTKSKKHSTGASPKTTEAQTSASPIIPQWMEQAPSIHSVCFERMAEDIFSVLWAQFNVPRHLVPLPTCPPNNYMSSEIVTCLARSVNYNQIVIRRRLFCLFQAATYAMPNSFETSTSIQKFLTEAIYHEYDNAEEGKPFDIFSKFIHSLTIPVEFVLYRVSKNVESYITHIPMYWKVFFTKILSKEFYKKGGFKALQEKCNGANFDDKCVSHIISKHCMSYTAEDLYQKYCDLCSQMPDSSKSLAQGKSPVETTPPPTQKEIEDSYLEGLALTTTPKKSCPRKKKGKRKR